jgi:hypothetical protein
LPSAGSPHAVLLTSAGSRRHSGEDASYARVTFVFFVFLYRKRGIEVVQVSTDLFFAIFQEE